MVTVIHANTSIVGDVNTITVDFLCLADAINQMKREKPEKWKEMVEEFKRIAAESDDDYEHKLIIEFLTNLQDLY